MVVLKVWFNMYRHITERQKHFMKRYISSLKDCVGDDKYEEHKTWWNTEHKNYLYNISQGTGCDTGLITIEAYEGKNFTDEHVYSNVKTSHKILELYKKGILDLDWLMDNVQHIVPTIKTTPEQNMLLRKITANMDYNQIKHMEHYREVTKGLIWNPSCKKHYSNTTKHMKDLLI